MSETGNNPKSNDSDISNGSADTPDNESNALGDSGFSGSALDSHLTHAVETVDDPIENALAGDVLADDVQESPPEEPEKQEAARDGANQETSQFAIPDVTSGGETSEPPPAPAENGDQNFDLDEISRQMEQIDTAPPWMPREEATEAVVENPIPDFSVETNPIPNPITSNEVQSPQVETGGESPGVAATPVDVDVQKDSPPTPPAATTSPAESTSQPSTANVQPESKGVPSMVFMAVLTYASVVTLVCFYLVMQSMNAKPHDLESLPDIKPPMKDDEIAYRLAPENAPMPKGHTLKIGESRRFGNIRLTPMKISYEPVKFEHYTGDASRKREADGPVLKLWMKFENVSEDQKFPPLDRKLMLIRIADRKKPDWLRSNNFVCAEAEKGKPGKQLLVYDLEMSGDWNFASIPDDLSIGPGQELQCYLPSEPVKFDALKGPMVWRVQFRKGYNPESFRGVTTLIEVQFDPSDIEKSVSWNHPLEPRRFIGGTC